MYETSNEIDLTGREELKEVIMSYLFDRLLEGDFKKLKKNDLQSFAFWLIKECKVQTQIANKAQEARNRIRLEMAQYMSDHEAFPDSTGIIERLRILAKDQQREINALKAELASVGELHD